MSEIIIEGRPQFRKGIKLPDPDDLIGRLEDSFLEVAEFFCDTIQGEGINIGHPAAFLRLQHCTQSCAFCDTTEVWRFGNPYLHSELYDLMDKHDLPRKLLEGQHLVLTGGSPLRQQQSLINFIDGFVERYGFKPYIEVENECTLMPDDDMIDLVDCWNNSPKLSNSYNSPASRYHPDILKVLSCLNNSWFKFVVSETADWKEIEESFIEPGIIERGQIILMPMGATRDELQKNREIVINLAIHENVRYCTREHIVVWDKKTGI